MKIRDAVNSYSKSRASYNNCRFWLIQALKQHPQFVNVEKYLDKLEFAEDGIYYRGKCYSSPDNAEDYEIFVRYEEFKELKDF